MSMRLVNAAFLLPLDVVPKIILLAICKHADENNECYPSKEVLRKCTSLSDRSVRGGIAQLVTLGFIKVEKRYGCNDYFSITDPVHWDDICTSFERSQTHTDLAGGAADLAGGAKLEPVNLAGGATNLAGGAANLAGGAKSHYKEPSLKHHLTIKTIGDEAPKKPKEKPAPKPASYSPALDLKQRDVPESLVANFLELRKAKKAPVTQIVIARIQSEADKAGWSLADALTECCLRGWQGFKAEWVAPKSMPGRNGPPPFESDLSRKRRITAEVLTGRSSWKRPAPWGEL